MLKEIWISLPLLVRFLLVSFADGVALGWTLGLLLIVFDIGAIGSLLQTTDSVGLTVLFFLHGGMLFGALAMGVAVMNQDGPEK